MVTLLVAVVPVVGVRVMPARPCVIRVGCGAVVLIVRRCALPEALAQRQLGRQLPDGLPLVQDRLLLLDEALPEVKDGGFGLLACPPPASRGSTLVARPVGPPWPYDRTCCWRAGRVCIGRDGVAHKARVAPVLIGSAQSGRCRREEEWKEEQGGAMKNQVWRARGAHVVRSRSRQVD